MFLCSKCRRLLLEKQNIRLFEVKQEDTVDEISLYEFYERKNKIKIVILYDYFYLLDFIVNIPDKHRLKDVFEIVQRQLNSLFEYKDLKDQVFFSKCKIPNFWNDFNYNFFKFLREKII